MKTYKTFVENLVATNNFEFVGGSIKPEDFRYIGMIINFSYESDYGVERDVEAQMEYDLVAGMNEEEAKDTIDIMMFSLIDGNFKCNVCNHKISRGCVYQNIHNNQLICMGYDCSTNMNFVFDVKGAKKQTMLARKKAQKLNDIQHLLEVNPGLEDALKTNNKLIRKISDSFKEYAKLSDKQISLVFKLADERKTFETNAKEVVEGKINDEFKIVSAKIKSSTFGRTTTHTIAITCEHKDGWKVYGNLMTVGSISDTLGSEIHDDVLKKFNYTGNITFKSEGSTMSYVNTQDFLNSLKGKTIKFTSTISKSKNDPFFGLFKRMSKLEVNE